MDNLPDVPISVNYNFFLKEALESLTQAQLRILNIVKGTDLCKTHPIQLPGLLQYCKQKSKRVPSKGNALVGSCEEWEQGVAENMVSSMFPDVASSLGKMRLCVVDFREENQAIDFAFKIIRHFTLLKNKEPKVIPPFAYVGQNKARRIIWIGAGQDQVNAGTDLFENKASAYKVALYWPKEDDPKEPQRCPSPSLIDQFITDYLNKTYPEDIASKRWLWISRDSETPFIQLSLENVEQIETINKQYENRKSKEKEQWRYRPIKDKPWSYLSQEKATD